MTNEKLSSLLGICIIPAIVQELKIPEEQQIEFLNHFYQSKLYEMLINAETAVWHLSAATLAEIYEYEQETGILDLPEEQS